jgi:hypothetical protein
MMAMDNGYRNRYMDKQWPDDRLSGHNRMDSTEQRTGSHGHSWTSNGNCRTNSLILVSPTLTCYMAL